MIKSNKGLTLVELIVSLAILGIIIVPLSTFFVNTIKINKDSEDRLKANQLAEKYIEKTKFSDSIVHENNKLTINTSDNGFTIDTTAQHNDSVVTYKKDEGDFVVYKKVETLKHKIKEEDKSEERSITYHGEMKIEKDNDTQDKIVFEDNTEEYIEENETIKIDVQKYSDTEITIAFNNKKKTVNNIDLSNEDINIKLNCNGNKKINLQVSSLNEPKTNIYIINSKDSNNEMIIEKSIGKVYIHKNIYDNTVAKEENNWVYKITITVQKNNREITKLVALKKID
ncbi:PilW family protein [Tepidibacter mesophilus]|uniref:PilW family protein n=1 Tax=Tepidibacter mesophilus TaxID=655607 RepID=UPI000C082CF2|nr:type II secretion system protein [Tepidibacter mesophilus]